MIDKHRAEEIRDEARAEVDAKFKNLHETYEELIEGYKKLTATVKAMQGIYNELDKLCTESVKS